MYESTPIMNKSGEIEEYSAKLCQLINVKKELMLKNHSVTIIKTDIGNNCYNC